MLAVCGLAATFSGPGSVEKLGGQAVFVAVPERANSSKNGPGGVGAPYKAGPFVTGLTHLRVQLGPKTGQKQKKPGSPGLGCCAGRDAHRTDLIVRRMRTWCTHFWGRMPDRGSRCLRFGAVQGRCGRGFGGQGFHTMKIKILFVLQSHWCRRH